MKSAPTRRAQPEPRQEGAPIRTDHNLGTAQPKDGDHYSKDGGCYSDDENDAAAADDDDSDRDDADRDGSGNDRVYGGRRGLYIDIEKTPAFQESDNLKNESPPERPLDGMGLTVEPEANNPQTRND